MLFDILEFLWKLFLIIVLCVWGYRLWRTSVRDDAAETRKDLVRTFLAFLPAYLFGATGIWTLITFLQDHNESWWIYSFPVWWLPTFHWWFWPFFVIGLIGLVFKWRRVVIVTGFVMYLIAVAGLDWLTLLEGEQREYEPIALTITQVDTADTALPIALEVDLSGLNDELGYDQELDSTKALHDADLALQWDVYKAGAVRSESKDLVGEPDSYSWLNPAVGPKWEIPVNFVLAEENLVPGTFDVYVDVQDATESPNDEGFIVATDMIQVRVEALGPQAAAVTPVAACVGDHVVDQPGREGNRLNDQGAEVRGPGSEEPFRLQIHRQAAHDPLTLIDYYIHTPLQDTHPIDPNNPGALVEGGVVKDGACYSQYGVEVFKRFAELWMDPSRTIITHQGEEVSYTEVNTGVDNGQVVQSEGAPADREGVDVAYRDEDGTPVGQPHSAYYVCTQVSSGREHAELPEGKTDNEEVPTTQETPASQAPSTPEPVVVTPPGSKAVSTRDPAAPNPADRGNGPAPVPRPADTSAPPQETVEGSVPDVEQPYTPPEATSSNPGTVQVDCDQNNDEVPDEGCG